MKEHTMYSTRIRKICAVILWLGSTAAWAAQAQTAQQSASASPLASQEADFVTRMFRFGSGEVLPQMTLHYATLGAPKRDATGRVTNAVLILHGTGGSGRNFLFPQFFRVLFWAGQLVDASRDFIILPDSIRADPGWNLGEYTAQPRGLQAALYILMLMGSSPLQMQKSYPAGDAADKYLDDWVKARIASADANDMLYQFDASRNYDPSPALDTIKARVVAINSADDIINPPELGVAEREIKKVKGARFILLPITDQTRGHGTHSVPVVWKQYLAELLAASEH